MKLALLVFALMIAQGFAHASPWTYRGTLNDGGKPANGSYDLRLTLIGEMDSRPITEPIRLFHVPVQDGNFSVDVDFGIDLSNAPAMRLKTEIAQEGMAFMALAEPTRFDPKATLAGVCWDTEGNAGTSASSDFIGTTDNQPLVLRTRSAQSLRIEPSAQLLSGLPITANMIAGSRANDAVIDVRGATIAGGGVVINGEPGYTNEGPNRVTDHYGAIGGGFANRAGDGEVGTIGDNVSNAAFATVGGGRNNDASGGKSTVGGGELNIASGSLSTIAGGERQIASGANSTVAGGDSNVATGSNSTVNGGVDNVASGQASSVSGGSGNRANGDAGSVGGGFDNCAGGDFSWVGGLHAITRPGNSVGDGTCAANSGDADGDEGTFVWADSQGVDFVSSGADQFLIRAQGGAAINSANPAGNALRVNGTLRVDDLGAAGSTGVCRNASFQLATCSSSIRYKDHIADLGLGLALTEQMRPVGYEWKGSHQPDIGFVAEEVAALDERLITRNAKGEVEGVKYERLTAVLAGAVQELAARDEMNKKDIVNLHEANAKLQARLEAIEERLAAIGR